MFALAAVEGTYFRPEVGIQPTLDMPRDPVGTDFGERLRVVRLRWTARLGDQELDDFVCLSRRALEAERGSAMIAKALHRSIYERLVMELADRVLLTGRLDRPDEARRLKVGVSAEYHWPHPLMRRRGEKWYPREEQLMRRSWQFATGHPTSRAFSTGFVELQRTIQRQGWPLDAEQQAWLSAIALRVVAGQLALPLRDSFEADREPLVSTSRL